MFKITRVLFGLPFVVFGISHFLNAGQLAGIVPIPGGSFWVYVTGLAFLLAGIAFVIGKKVALAGKLLSILLLILILSVHVPALFSEASRQFAMVNFLKDFALMAAACAFSCIAKEKNKQQEIPS